MQTPTIYGLRGSDDLNFRSCIIRCMYSALPQDADKLREAWGKAKVTPEEARKQLEMRDVAVTNKKDKTTQLDKLIRLNHKVKTYNSDDVGNDNIPDPIRIDKAPPAGPPTYVV